jgi:hypothetical protein
MPHFQVGMDRCIDLPFAPYPGLVLFLDEHDPPDGGKQLAEYKGLLPLTVGLVKTEVSYFVDTGAFVVTCKGAVARNMRALRAMAAELVDVFGFEISAGDTIPGFTA